MIKIRSNIKNQKYIMNTMFYDTHHQEPSRAVHNAITWVSNVTGSPCGLNPCGVCIERKKLGLTNPL